MKLMAMFPRMLVLGALAAACLSAAGCNQDQKDAAVAAVAADCPSVAALGGQALSVVVESNLPGAVPIQLVSGGISILGNMACDALTSAVKNAVNGITAAGGTASVSIDKVSASGGKKTRLRSLRFKPLGGGSVELRDLSTGKRFVIPPDGLLDG